MEKYQPYVNYVLTAILAGVVVGAGAITATDQTDALEQQGETIAQLDQTVSTLETQLGQAQSTIGEQKQTIGEQKETIGTLRGEIKQLEGEKTGLEERIENAPSYEPVVEVQDSEHVSYFPGADRDVVVPVTVNEEIRGQPERYTIEYDYDVPGAVGTEDSVAVYDGPEGVLRNDIGGGTNGSIEFAADEAGIYYIEMDLSLANDVASDADDEEELSRDGFNVEFEPALDYYTVVR
jgi:hypothetical protein